ncbi:MAG: hypothetical protein R2734_12830 [Nocardioides sp.]
MGVTGVVFAAATLLDAFGASSRAWWPPQRSPRCTSTSPTPTRSRSSSRPRRSHCFWLLGISAGSAADRIRRGRRIAERRSSQPLETVPARIGDDDL